MSSLLSQPRGCGPAVPIGPHTLSLSLLSLPEGLLHAIAALVPQYDRLRLGSVCRALRQACAAPTLFPELCLYLSGQRWQDPDAADELHRSLRWGIRGGGGGQNERAAAVSFAVPDLGATGSCAPFPCPVGRGC